VKPIINVIYSDIMSLKTVCIKTKSSILKVSVFGAHILSWKCKGEERLFLSRKAVFDGKKAIRGGIPLVFPQFGRPVDSLPSHGFARISVWDVQSLKETDTKSELVLTLKPSSILKDFRDAFDFNFELVYEICLTETNLSISLRAINQGTKKFTCQMLLHTYLKLDSIERTKISGLAKLNYQDKLKEGKVYYTQPDSKFQCITEETDRVYKGPLNRKKIEIIDTMLIENDSDGGMCDVVLWNPWIEKSKRMGDLDNTEYHDFVCVEPGIVLSPVVLSRGDSAVISQTLTPKFNL